MRSLLLCCACCNAPSPASLNPHPCPRPLPLPSLPAATCKVVSVVTASPAVANRRLLAGETVHVIASLESKNAEAAVAALQTDTVYTLLVPAGITVVPGSVKAALGAYVAPAPVVEATPTTPTDAAATPVDAAGNPTDSAPAASGGDAVAATEGSSSSGGGGGGSSIGPIIGGVVGGLAAVAIIVGAVVVVSWLLAWLGCLPGGVFWAVLSTQPAALPLVVRKTLPPTTAKTTLTSTWATHHRLDSLFALLPYALLTLPPSLPVCLLDQPTPLLNPMLI